MMFPSLAQQLPASLQGLCSAATEGLQVAAALNAFLNLMTVGLIAYVTRITHKLDKEVGHGGE